MSKPIDISTAVDFWNLAKIKRMVRMRGRTVAFIVGDLGFLIAGAVFEGCWELFHVKIRWKGFGKPYRE